MKTSVTRDGIREKAAFKTSVENRMQHRHAVPHDDLIVQTEFTVIRGLQKEHPGSDEVQIFTNNELGASWKEKLSIN